MKKYSYFINVLILVSFSVTGCQTAQQVATPTIVPTTQIITPNPMDYLGVSQVQGELEIQPETPYEMRQREFLLYDLAPLLGSVQNDAGLDLEPSAQMKVLNGNIQYEINLPLVPSGTYVDVDQNGNENKGVMIFTAQLREKVVKEAPLAADHPISGLWPMAQLALTFDQQNPSQIVSGWFLVWAADNQQMFPVGTGDDGLLFTSDDPVQPILQGYTSIQYADGKMIWDRSSSARVTISSIKDRQHFDFSTLDALSAYDETLKVFEKYYPAWDAEARANLVSELREKLATASTSKNNLAEQQVFGELVAGLDDALVSYSPDGNMVEWLKTIYPADFGFLATTIEDKSVRIGQVRPNGPADKAGLSNGDILHQINGVAIDKAIGAQEISYFASSDEETTRKLKEFFLLRGDVGGEITLKVQTIAGETKMLTLKAEQDSALLRVGLENIFGGRFSPGFPIIADYYEDYAYIQVNDFDQDPQLTRQLFEDALQVMSEKQLKLLVLDLQKVSGTNFLELAGYFTDKPLELGKLSCLQQTDIPVTVAPGVHPFALEGIAVMTGNSCSGACEMEVLALQQLDNVITYGVSDSAGAMNIGYQAEIKIPGNSKLSFPMCQFTSDLPLEGVITPDIELADSFYSHYYGYAFNVSQAYGDLLIKTRMNEEPEQKLQSVTSFDTNKYRLYLNYQNPAIVGDLNQLLYFHDVEHYDMYGHYFVEDPEDSIHFVLCTEDMDQKKNNLAHTTVEVSLDGELLSDFTMSVDHYIAADKYSRYNDRPCIGWVAGYKDLTKGHHQMLVRMTIDEPLVYNESYWEPGKYEFDLHLLVQAKEVEGGDDAK